MRSDIYGIRFLLILDSIFGNKRSKESNLHLHTFKTNIYERHLLLISNNLMARLGPPWTCVFFIMLPVCLFIMINALQNSQ